MQTQIILTAQLLQAMNFLEKVYVNQQRTLTDMSLGLLQVLYLNPATHNEEYEQREPSYLPSHEGRHPEPQQRL